MPARKKVQKIHNFTWFQQNPLGGLKSLLRTKVSNHFCSAVEKETIIFLSYMYVSLKSFCQTNCLVLCLLSSDHYRNFYYMNECPEIYTYIMSKAGFD